MDFKYSVAPFLRCDKLLDWVKDPLLFKCTVSHCLLSDIQVALTFSNSAVWKSRSDPEWSVCEKSEIFNQSLVLLLELINIDDLPSLFDSITSA